MTQEKPGLTGFRRKSVRPGGWLMSAFSVAAIIRATLTALLLAWPGPKTAGSVAQALF